MPSSPSAKSSLELYPNGTTWTCFGCAHEHADADDMPEFCPWCGGVWIRLMGTRRRRTWWQRLRRRLGI